MKFIVDAQLPRRLAAWLTSVGHDARHTLDMPSGNRTPDQDIAACAVDENRVLVTKDSDFVSMHLLSGRPEKLLLVATGNTTNKELLALFELHMNSIVAALGEGQFVEMTQQLLIIHGPRESA